METSHFIISSVKFRYNTTFSLLTGTGAMFDTRGAQRLLVDGSGKARGRGFWTLDDDEVALA